MVASAPIDQYLKAFRTLNVNRRAGRASPHKACMLLAVLGLAEAGKLEHNEIRFEPPLLERYQRFFEIVRGASDHPNPYFPFFHLRGDGFWHLQPKAGRELVLDALTTIRSLREIEANVEYAKLDPALHELVLQPGARKQLQDELVTAWFGSYTAPLTQLFDVEHSADQYEADLRQRLSGGDAKLNAPDEPARSTAFRRIVAEAYDYRCAASGWRIILPDSSVLVEAAHLVPFAETHDDDPHNGIALTPSFH
jgi:putative restriction endonuclease